MILYYCCFFYFLATSVSIIIPSIQTSQCSSNSLNDCELVVVLLVTIDKEGSDWNAEIVFDEPISDSNGRLFIPKEPVYLSFRKKNQKTLYPLHRESSCRNAYEYITPKNQGSQCSQEEYTLCCSNNYKILNYNETIYESFSILNPHTKFDIIITSTQGDIIYDISLTETERSNSLPGINAELIISAVQNPPTLFSSRLVIPSLYPESKGFLVPPYFFGSDINEIGITETSWILNANCDYPEGYLVRVNDGNIYDQFSKFRGITMESFMPHCLWVDEWSTSDQYQTIEQGFDCNMQQTEIISLQIESSKIRLIKMFAEPYITDQGVLPIHSTDQYAYLFVDVMNIGLYGSIVTLELISCSQDFGELDSIIEHMIEPHETIRYLFRLSTTLVVETIGECTVNIIQHGIISIETIISLEVETIHVPSLDIISYSDDDDCIFPSEIVVIDGILFCQHPCSMDEKKEIKLGDEYCTPVNCNEKYAGAKDFFNFDTNLCEPLAICSGNEYLNINSNQCMNSIVSPSPVITIQPNSPSRSPIISFQNLTPVSPNINCGIHGELTLDGNTCKCDSGWVSDPNQDIFSFEWCTVPYQPVTNQNNEQNTNTTTGLISKIKQEPKFTIIAFSIIFVIFILTASILIIFFCKKNIYSKYYNWMNKQEEIDTMDARSGINPYSSDYPHATFNYK